MKRLIYTLLFLFTFAASPLHAEGKTGVVLMHGKWGTSLPGSPVGKLASYLRNEGFLVAAPEMPWSRERGLDKPYEDAMSEIDEIVKQLRDQGATRVVVGGHSMGANAAIGYGARREGLAGVMAIAPGAC